MITELQKASFQERLFRKLVYSALMEISFFINPSSKFIFNKKAKVSI